MLPGQLTFEVMIGPCLQQVWQTLVHPVHRLSFRKNYEIDLSRILLVFVKCTEVGFSPVLRS